MNRIILFIATLLISSSALAQVDGNYNYSIGVKGYSMMQLPKILQQTNTDDYATMWLNSGIIRLNDNQMAFRISGHYFYKKDFTFKNQCDNCENATGNLSDYSIKLGFEKNFNYSIIQPYFAVDLGYRSNNFKGDIKSVNPASLNLPFTVVASKNGGTLTPVMGLKINIGKQISLFAESSIDFYYAYERQETILNDAANTRTFAKYTKFESLLNPVTAGLQIHLVGKN